MEKILLKFTDFWEGFSVANNYFFNLLCKSYFVELSEEPEIIIYSCYGKEYLKYNCIRIFFTGENLRPDFTGCDFAITCDHNKDPRHYRLPLYAIYTEGLNAFSKLLEIKSEEEARNIWRSKTKFCCMVVSNPKSAKRLAFFDKLSAYKKVDSGGKTFNNIGGPVKDKMEFIKDYRFVIAFENSSYPGYVTEKIVEPLIADCIPLYWGDPLVGTEFNTNCFLEFTNDKSEHEFLGEIIAIDNSEDRAVKMLVGPKFKNAKIPGDLNKEKLLNFFEGIIRSRDSYIPVARKHKYLHVFNLKKKYYLNRIKGKFNLQGR